MLNGVVEALGRGQATMREAQEKMMPRLEACERGLGCVVRKIQQFTPAVQKEIGEIKKSTARGFERIAQFFAQKHGVEEKEKEEIKSVIKDLTVQLSDTRVSQGVVFGKMSEMEKLTERIPEMCKVSTPVVMPLTVNVEQPAVSSTLFTTLTEKEKERERVVIKIPHGGFAVEPEGTVGTHGPIYTYVESQPEGNGPDRAVRPIGRGGAVGTNPSQIIPVVGDLLQQEVSRTLRRPFFDEADSKTWGDFTVEWEDYWGQISRGVERSDAEKLQLFESCLSARLQEEIKLTKLEGFKVTFTSAFAILQNRFAPLTALNARRLWYEVTMRNEGKVNRREFNDFVLRFRVAWHRVKDATPEEARRLFLERVPNFISNWCLEEEDKKNAQNPVVKMVALPGLLEEGIKESVRQLTGGIVPVRV